MSKQEEPGRGQVVEPTFEERMVGHVFSIVAYTVALVNDKHLSLVIQSNEAKQLRTSAACLIAQPLADLNRLAGAAERIADALEQISLNSQPSNIHLQRG